MGEGSRSSLSTLPGVGREFDSILICQLLPVADVEKGDSEVNADRKLKSKGHIASFLDIQVERPCGVIPTTHVAS